MVPSSIRWLPSTLIVWITPVLDDGIERGASGRVGLGVWAAAVPIASAGIMTRTAIRHAARDRTVRIVNKRVGPPTARLRTAASSDGATPKRRTIAMGRHRC